jgi:hypothetical protein
LEGQGSEEKPLRLIIDAVHSCPSECHCHRCTL